MWVSVWWKTQNYETMKLFIITEKVRVKESKWDGVGVMKDKELKLEDVKTPQTLGDEGLKKTKKVKLEKKKN